VTWTPEALSSFLDHVFRNVVRDVHGVIAAGHAATYVLHYAAHNPGMIGRAALIAPTWRGPLPTLAGGQRPLFQTIRRVVETPRLGPILYRLNVNPFMVRKMVAGHVYSDASWLTDERLTEKCQVIDAPGARFASAAFVTGALDRVTSRAEFLALAGRAAIPTLVIYGAETPPDPGRRSRHLPRFLEFKLGGCREASCRSMKNSPTTSRKRLSPSSRNSGLCGNRSHRESQLGSHSLNYW
jgi:pimeloyl-ACP methyl ester carboxylesterase